MKVKIFIFYFTFINNNMRKMRNISTLSYFYNENMQFTIQKDLSTNVKYLNYDGDTFESSNLEL